MQTQKHVSANRTLKRDRRPAAAERATHKLCSTPPPVLYRAIASAHIKLEEGRSEVLTEEVTLARFGTRILRILRQYAIHKRSILGLEDCLERVDSCCRPLPIRHDPESNKVSTDE